MKLDKLKFWKKEELGSRVTTENVEDHREAVIKRGRKFKLPVALSKYRVVLYTIIIALMAGALVGLFGYLELYKFQNTSNVMFRITRVVPVPVARVADQNVLYSDYLLIYLSALRPVEKQNGEIDRNSDDGKALILGYKRTALDEAISYSYALMLASQEGIKITDEEIEAKIADYRRIEGKEWSEESFYRTISDNFGLNKAEYRRLIELSLIRGKMMERVDTNARTLASQIEVGIAQKVGFSDIVKDLEGVSYETSSGLVSEMILDGGRATMAFSLKKGETSGRFVSRNGEGFYYVKVLDKTENMVSYESLFVPFRVFATELSEIIELGQVREFIYIGE
jgi:hypothetical protein